MDYEKAYNEAIEKIRNGLQPLSDGAKISGVTRAFLEEVFPELKESEDERIRRNIIAALKGEGYYDCDLTNECIAWIEKQGEKSVEPNWCHHKVDLSDCTEEYRKAYYDGWNNCNQQRSQCKLEKSDVLKCLINGMKFYYEDNEEAMWGTEKFSMKVKDILSWLEKQGEQNSTLSDEDKMMLNELIIGFYAYKDLYPNFWKLRTDEIIEWLKKKKDEHTTDNG